MDLRINCIRWIRNEYLADIAGLQDEAREALPLHYLQSLLDELVIEERYEECGEIFNLMKELWDYQSENTSSHSR